MLHKRLFTALLRIYDLRFLERERDEAMAALREMAAVEQSRDDSIVATTNRLSSVSISGWCDLGSDGIVAAQAELEAALLKMKAAREQLVEHRQQGDGQDSMCCICKEAVKTVLLMPCRHLCVCVECCDELTRDARGSFRGKCPVCRVHIESSLRIFS